MQAWFETAAIIDAILVLICIEAFCLGMWARKRRWRQPFGRVIAMLLPGAFLMLAIKFAMQDANWTWIAGALTAAGICHAFDVYLRFSRE